MLQHLTQVDLSCLHEQCSILLSMDPLSALVGRGVLTEEDNQWWSPTRSFRWQHPNCSQQWEDSRWISTPPLPQITFSSLPSNPLAGSVQSAVHLEGLLCCAPLMKVYPQPWDTDWCEEPQWSQCDYMQGHYIMSMSIIYNEIKLAKIINAINICTMMSTVWLDK